jgi:hypothetical protein
MRADLTNLALTLGTGRDRGLSPDRRQRQALDGPFLGMAEDGQPIHLPVTSLEQAAHAICLGSSGTGKSLLLASTIAQEIARALRTLSPERHPAELVIIPKNDFLVALQQATAFLAPEALERMVCLNPFSERGFAFNLNKLPLNGTPIEIRAWQLSILVAEVSTATGLLRSGSAGAGARQIDVLNNLLLAALTVEHPRANVLLAYDALITPRGFERLASITPSSRARAFLLATKLGDELAASCAARLRMAFGATDSLERMMGSEHCISFDLLTAVGCLCLIVLGEPFGGMTGLQTFWASLLAILGIDHALARPSPFVDGHHLRIVIDEFQIVAPVLSERILSLLTTGRARHTSVILASQGTALISRAAEALIPAIMTNCPSKLVSRLSATDAELFSRELTPTPGNPERPKYLRERFAAALSNLPDRQFWYLEPSRRRRFTSAPIDMAQWERAAEEHTEAIAAAERRFALPASTPPRTTLSELTPHFDAAPGRGRLRLVSDPDRDATNQRAMQPRSQWG